MAQIIRIVIITIYIQIAFNHHRLNFLPSMLAFHGKKINLSPQVQQKDMKTVTSHLPGNLN